VNPKNRFLDYIRKGALTWKKDGLILRFFEGKAPSPDGTTRGFEYINEKRR